MQEENPTLPSLWNFLWGMLSMSRAVQEGKGVISPPSPSFRGGHCSTSVYCIDAVINVTSLLVSMIESSHVSQLNMAIIISLYRVAGGEALWSCSTVSIRHHGEV